VVENTVLGPIRVPPTGFFQVNPPVLDKMLDAVSLLIRDIAPATLIDAYCGCGVFSIAAARAGVAHVLGIEVNRAAIRLADQNRIEREMTGVAFTAARAETALAEALDCVDPETAAVRSRRGSRGISCMCRVHPTCWRAM
jgi:tRNA/tmRNA/rRNA uracil-C5-methylase (TrmA/RlmC/RlmD family)